MRSSRWSLWLVVAFSALVLPWAIFIHYYRLREIGVIGSDDSFYWQTALNWFRGEAELTRHYRPLAYGLDAGVFRLFGVTDWGLQAFHATCDILVGLSLVFLAWAWRRDVVLGLLVMCAYFLLPEPLAWARGASVHAPSSLALIWSVISFVLASRSLTRRGEGAGVFASGLCLSMAWHIHPDLAVLGLAFVLTLFVRVYRRSDRRGFDLSRFALLLALFLVGYFFAFVVFCFAFGISEVLHCLSENHSAESGEGAGYLRTFTNLSVLYLQTVVGPIWAVLYAATLGVLCYRWFRRRIQSAEILIAVSGVLYLALCALLFSKNIIPRLFVPFAPLVLLTVIAAGLQVGTKRYRGGVIAFFVLVSLAVALMGWRQINHTVFTYPVSVYKMVDMAMFDRIAPDRKLLIAPISSLHIHVPFQKETYIGGNAVYLPLTTESSLEGVIRAHRVKYILLSAELRDLRLFGAHSRKEMDERLSTLMGLDRTEWTAEREMDIFHAQMARFNPRLIWESPRGKIYEIDTDDRGRHSEL